MTGCLSFYHYTNRKNALGYVLQFNKSKQASNLDLDKRSCLQSWFQKYCFLATSINIRGQPNPWESHLKDLNSCTECVFMVCMLLTIFINLLEHHFKLTAEAILNI